MIRATEKRALRSALNGTLIGFAILVCLAALCVSPEVRAENPALPAEAQKGVEKMYDGDPDGAIRIFRSVQAASPDSALGYLLEGEARWWKIYCAALDVKWGFVDALKRPRQPGDDEYLVFTDKIIALAEAQYNENDSAEFHLYAGLGWGLKARLYGLQAEHRAAARAGVRGREEFLRAAQLDPQMTDANTGLGLYNYYVDTLSGIVKVLRFFLGIPGGNKEEGIRQLETAITGGGMTATEGRFYLGRNLRTYDQQYERAVTFIEPLTRQYPHNPIFLLLLGNLKVELGRKTEAAADFRAARDLAIADPTCAAHVRHVTGAFLASLN